MPRSSTPSHRKLVAKLSAKHVERREACDPQRFVALCHTPILSHVPGEQALALRVHLAAHTEWQRSERLDDKA